MCTLICNKYTIFYEPNYLLKNTSSKERYCTDPYIQLNKILSIKKITELLSDY